MDRSIAARTWANAERNHRQKAGALSASNTDFLHDCRLDDLPVAQ